MKIAVSSQNLRTISAHAGKASRFYIYTIDEQTKQVTKRELLELAPPDILHNRFHKSDDPWAPHPLFEVDVVITAGAGPGFVNRLSTQNTRVVITPEQDPDIAVALFLEDNLPQLPPAHHH